MAFSQLRQPVTDMGFKLSDMCYDAIHVRNGRFFLLEDHLDRWDQAAPSGAMRRWDMTATASPASCMAASPAPNCGWALERMKRAEAEELTPKKPRQCGSYMETSLHRSCRSESPDQGSLHCGTAPLRRGFLFGLIRALITAWSTRC